MAKTTLIVSAHITNLKPLAGITEAACSRLDPFADNEGGADAPRSETGTVGENVRRPESRPNNCEKYRFLAFDRHIAQACGVKAAIAVENFGHIVARQLMQSARNMSPCDVAVSYTQEDMASYLGFTRRMLADAISKAIAKGYLTSSQNPRTRRYTYRLTEKSGYRAVGPARVLSTWCVRAGDLEILSDWASTVLYGFRARIRKLIENGHHPEDGRYHWYGSLTHLYQKHYAGCFSRRTLNYVIRELVEKGRLFRRQYQRRSSYSAWALGEWDENDLLWDMASARHGSPHTFRANQIVRPVPWDSFRGKHPGWAVMVSDAVTEEGAE